MSERGVVKKVIFEIEYPDGSTKVATLEDELSGLQSIILAESMVLERDKNEWNVSDDWKDNPTMILVYPEDRSTPYCRWKCHAANWDDVS